MESEQKLTDISGTHVNVKPVTPEKKISYLPKNPCHRCGRTGHFSSTCKVKTDVKGNSIESDSEYDSDKYY